MTHKIGRGTALVCALLLAAGVLGGCFGGASIQDEEGQKNRIYLSQVNQIMVELDSSLQSFADALSSDTPADASLQLNQALKTLDKLDALEAPAAMKDVQEDYVKAAAALEEALQDYVDLTEEMRSASANEGADLSAYADRIAAIQDAYDDGMKALEAADEAAAKASA